MKESTMTTTAPRTRTDLPAPGLWSIDSSHSSVEFVVRHLMVAKVRGRFAEFSGDIHVGETPEESKVVVAIAPASITTGDEQRDGHLKSADFFDVEQYPTITFESTGVRSVDSRYALDGNLTVHGESKPVTLELEYQGSITDPFGNDKAVFSASTEIDREDWGLTWNQTLETGGVLVGKKARIELEIEAVHQA
jgi:polyisoprenoid-binding protein YceI